MMARGVFHPDITLLEMPPDTNTGSVAKIVPLLEEWLKKYPEDRNSRFQAALGWMILQRPEKSREHLDKIIADHPRDSEALNELACLVLATDPKAALPFFDRALAGESSSPDYISNRAICLLRLGKIPEAEASAREALQAQPGKPRPHNVLSQILMENGKFPEGLAEAKKALEIDPKNWIALSNLAAAYFRRGQREQWLEKIDEAYAVAPGEAEVMRRKLLSLIPPLNPQPDRAAIESFVAQVTRNQADNFAVMASLMDFHVAMGNWSYVYPIGKRLDEAGYMTLQLAQQYGGALNTLGYGIDAVRYHEKALEVFPGDPVLLTQAAFANKLAGNPREAEKYYQANLKSAQPQMIAALQLGDLLVSEGKFDQTLALLSTCNELFQSSLQGVAVQAFLRGRCHLEAGNYVEAEKNLDVYLKNDVTNADAWLLMAQVKAALGKHDEMNAATKRASALSNQNPAPTP